MDGDSCCVKRNNSEERMATYRRSHHPDDRQYFLRRSWLGKGSAVFPKAVLAGKRIGSGFAHGCLWAGAVCPDMDHDTFVEIVGLFAED